ncbi:MAG: hypothetical protein ACRDA4_05065 [Filifactoraceae bacterium]
MENKKSKGSILILVIVIFSFVTVLASIIVSLIYNNRHQAITQAESIQVYYLTKRAMETTAEGLINGSGAIKIESYKSGNPKMIVNDIELKNSNNKVIGQSTIKVERFPREKNGVTDIWVKISATTFMRDVRKGETLDGKNRVKSTGELFILVKNPLIQEQDIKIS